MTIYFEEESGCEFGFPVKKQLDRLVQSVAEFVGCPYEVEVSVTITTEEKIRNMNRQFRQVDRATDVLSFPMMEYDAPADFEGEAFQLSMTVSPETEELMLGDIVLCAGIIQKQAEEYGHSVLREFSFLVVHSMLHLFGYDHMEEEERIQMEEEQRKIMEQLQIYRS